jgi:hypothetical protein
MIENIKNALEEKIYEDGNGNAISSAKEKSISKLFRFGKNNNNQSTTIGADKSKSAKKRTKIGPQEESNPFPSGSRSQKKSKLIKAKQKLGSRLFGMSINKQQTFNASGTTSRMLESSRVGLH